MQNEKNLQYKGFLNTPKLWGNAPVLGLQQINLPVVQATALSETDLPKRLGHRVEQFVFEELKAINTCEIVATNLQIIEDKITLGEIDCLLQYEPTPIHLEIIYKFYLYDESVGTSAIEHWIGPNRKDSFIDKLTKLKQKQLPLLQHPFTQNCLTKIGVNTKSIKQQVYFKAQLFVPIKRLKQRFNIINNNCIAGFYVHYNQLSPFKNNTFYIPSKLDWLVTPHQKVTWLNFQEFEKSLSPYMLKKQAPMCWLKHPNGKMQKFFVVWW